MSISLWQSAHVQVFVTGVAGFVGRRLEARLEAAGVRVIGTDLELDVADADRVADAVSAARPDAIVHLAAISSVSQAESNPQAVYRVNFLGAHSILEAARKISPGVRLLVVGSGQVYGAADPGAPPFDECSPLRPDSPYAWSKAAADLLGGVYAKEGVDVVRVRPFNHTGAGRPERFVESSFARQIAEIEAGLRPPEIAVGNLDAVRDFLDVEDVVDAYVRLLDPKVPAGPYNVASGKGTSIRELLDSLLAHTSIRPEVEVDQTRWRPADTSIGSADRLAKTTGWAPTVPLAETLKHLLDRWREAVGAE
jgi:GDP-4-dehydro-6-deoxy-D-mannose reductase